MLQYSESENDDDDIDNDMNIELNLVKPNSDVKSDAESVSS